MPVSKYQVAMVTATLVNRAALPPYRSKSNTKGRENKIGNGEQKSPGENSHNDRDKACSRLKLEVVEGGSIPSPDSSPRIGASGKQETLKGICEQLCQGSTEVVVSEHRENAALAVAVEFTNSLFETSIPLDDYVRVFFYSLSHS